MPGSPDLRGFSVCPACSAVYAGAAGCPGCEGRPELVAPASSPVAVAGPTPLRRGRALRSPFRRPSSILPRRRIVPGRFGWLRDHAAAWVLASLGVLLLILAAVVNGVG